MCSILLHTMPKKTCHIAIRVDDGTRREIEDAARAGGHGGISEYLRALHNATAHRQARQQAANSADVPRVSMPVYHVDDLGPDPLRDDTRALQR